MSVTPETIPTTWTAADEQFFSLTARLFLPAMLWGASSLLGSYDPEPTPESPGTPTAQPTLPLPTSAAVPEVRHGVG